MSGRHLTLSKIGDVKIKLHRPVAVVESRRGSTTANLEGKIKTLTIHRQASGWFACFSCEVEANPLPPTNRSVGVDVGIENFAITSDGEFFPPIQDLRKAEAKIKRAQREVARRKKGSKRRKKSVWRQSQSSNIVSIFDDCK